MEASAKFRFDATEADELSFKQNDCLKIINKEDKDWYKAEIHGKTGLIPANYIDMQPHPWYVGKIPRVEAEKMLLKNSGSGYPYQPDGAFLVRNSETDSLGLSLSVKHGSGVQHFKILHDANGEYFLWDKKFKSINQLIEYHRRETVTRDHNRTILLKDMVPETEEEIYKALYEFNPEEPEELAFRRGDCIRIISKEDPNWWKGELNGNVGLVPCTYVKKI